MSAKWAEGLPRWQPHHGENGQVYGLTHLHPHRLALSFAARPNYPAREIEIRIGYSSHPFTVECPEGDLPHAPYSKPRDSRVFCLERYQWSLQLPAIMQGIDARRCYATHHKNHFVVNTIPLLPAGTEYWVFFNTKKVDANTMRLFVESAYAGDPSRAPHGRRRESVMFRALVNKTLELEKANPA